MTQVTIHQAKTHLSKLIQKALEGEEVVIAKADQPLVRLQVVKKASSQRELGRHSGMIRFMAGDFNETPPDFGDYMK